MSEDDQLDSLIDRGQRIAALVGAPTLTVSVMYYFGWVRTERAAGDLGVHQSVFDLSVTDYVLRGAAPVVGLLSLTFVLAAVAVVAYFAREHNQVLQGGRERLALAACGVGGLAIAASRIAASVQQQVPSDDLRRQAMLLAASGFLFWTALNGRLTWRLSQALTTGPARRAWEGLRTASHLILMFSLLFGLFNAVRADAARDGSASIQTVREQVRHGERPQLTLTMVVSAAPDLVGSRMAEPANHSGDDELVVLTGLHLLLENNDRLVVVTSCFGWESTDSFIADVGIIETEAIRSMRFRSSSSTSVPDAEAASCLARVSAPEVSLAELSEEVVRIAEVEGDASPDRLLEIVAQLQLASIRLNESDYFESLAEIRVEIVEGRAAGAKLSGDALGVLIVRVQEVAEGLNEAMEMEAQDDRTQQIDDALDAVEDAESALGTLEQDLADAEENLAPASVQEELEDKVEQAADDLAGSQDTLNQVFENTEPRCTAEAVDNRVVVSWSHPDVVRVTRATMSGSDLTVIDFNPSTGLAIDFPSPGGRYVYDVSTATRSATCPIWLLHSENELSLPQSGFSCDGTVPIGPDVIPNQISQMSGADLGLPGVVFTCGSSGPDIHPEAVLTFDFDDGTVSVLPEGTPLINPLVESDGGLGIATFTTNEEVSISEAFPGADADAIAELSLLTD